MIYTKSAKALFTGISPSMVTQTASNWSGYRGIKFKVADKPLMVTALGRLYCGGDSRTHQVILQKAQPSAGDTAGRQSQVLASALVKAVLPQTGEPCNYAPLEHPVVLEPFTEYYLASYENNSAGEQYPLAGTGTLLSGSMLTVDPNIWTNENGSWSSASGQCANVNLRIQ